MEYNYLCYITCT